MAEERSNQASEQRQTDFSAVVSAARAATQDAARHITGYVPPAPSTAVATETYTQQNGFGKINAVVATADLGTTQRNAAMDAQLALEALRESEQRPRTVLLGPDAREQAKDDKSKEGASADAPAAEKGASAPSVEAALINTTEKNTRAIINETTGQTTDQQQPSQQQSKAAEDAKKTAVTEPGKKTKLTGHEKAYSEAMQNLQDKLGGKGKDDKNKPRVAVVSNNSPKAPVSTPPRPQPPKGHAAPSAPRR